MAQMKSGLCCAAASCRALRSETCQGIDFQISSLGWSCRCNRLNDLRSRPADLSAFASPDLALVSGGGRSYDVSADGQRFVMTMPVGDGDEEAAPPSIRVVENWYEEFRDRE